MPVDLNQPQIVAALVGGGVAAVVSLVVAGINQLSVRSIHKEKLAFDQRQSERRVDAEIALAEKKLSLDQSLARWKRRHELAELALAAFYEARDALEFSRSRILWGDEGKSRPKIEGESEKVRKRRELYFIPIERLNAENALFARILAMRYSFTAHFGEGTAEPFNAILQARNEITSAASILIQTVSEFGGQDSIEMRNVLGWGPAERPNKLDREIASAVAAIEEICRPVLSQQAP